jgi:hypothetical protein
MVTRPLPQRLAHRPATRAPSRRLVRHREALLVAGILLVAALAHGVNMFHFPYYHDDEGTYMAQAWAVRYLGRLSHYTYWYDHAPVGWLQLTAWTSVTGGFDTFGTVVASGRVLMLVLQVGATGMLYRIGREVSGSVTAATLAALLFALSGYGIYWHRRVMLDNIATFWMLLSVLLLVAPRLSLTRVWLSAAALAVSILSKELTIVVAPVLLYLVVVRAHASQRWFASIGWIAIVGSIVSLYVLMAILKSELFPTGTLLGGTADHVSLVGTLQYQASRGKDAGIADMQSGFWTMARKWARDEPLLVIVGTFAGMTSLLSWKRHRVRGVIGLLTLSLWGFLGRGGEILGFYLVPLLPVLALNIGLGLGPVTKTWHAPMGWDKLNRARAALPLITRPVVAGLCFVGALVGYSSPNLGFDRQPFALWENAQADSARQARDWMTAHISPDERIVVDDVLWADLHASADGTRAHTRWPNVHYHWKVERDPAVREAIFRNDWRNIDLIVTTPGLLGDAHGEGMPLVLGAVTHSTPLARFDTGGWPIEIRRVEK